MKLRTIFDLMETYGLPGLYILRIYLARIRYCACVVVMTRRPASLTPTHFATAKDVDVAICYNAGAWAP